MEKMDVEEINDKPNIVEKADGKFSEIRNKLRSVFQVRSELLRVFLAEFFGTFIFISFGLASVAQYVFAGETRFLSVNVSFGFGLMVGIIVAGKISGGHLNPAVSLAFMLKGQLSPLRFIVYVIAQNLGAFLAAVMVYLTYLNELNHNPNFSGDMYSLKTAGIFATFPRSFANVTSGVETFSHVWDQFFSTALFIIAILSVCDARNTNVPHVIKAILIGLTLVIIGAAFGINCGFAVNPARDFAPRVFLLIAGWGFKVFNANYFFFWIPLIMPMVGSVFAVFSYQLFIANHWPNEDRL